MGKIREFLSGLDEDDLEVAANVVSSMLKEKRNEERVKFWRVSGLHCQDQNFSQDRFGDAVIALIDSIKKQASDLPERDIDISLNRDFVPASEIGNYLKQN